MQTDDIRQKVAEAIADDIINFQELDSTSTFPTFLAETPSRKLFIKSSGEPHTALQNEATGLTLLKKTYRFVPEVFAFGQTYLVTEYIEIEARQDQFWKNLASSLADHHQKGGDHYGFFEDNWIGAAPQKNLASDRGASHWATFFWENRLAAKLTELETKRGFKLDPETREKLKEGCFEQLDSFESHPSLLHGDLWGGNILCGPQQQAFIIDPAVYYGDREADIAMTECFGGFSPLFYKHYNEKFPLQDGYETRKHLYNLYHMLNHFVIFGDTYKQVSLNIIHSIV